MSSRRWSPARHAGRVAGGAAALRAGRSFEEELEATHDSAEYSALCAMSRAYPPVGGPPGALFYRGKGKVDFVGHVLGVPVAFDVKSNNAEASYHHDPRDCHELDFLLTGERGAACPSCSSSIDRSTRCTWWTTSRASAPARTCSCARTRAAARYPRPSCRAGPHRGGLAHSPRCAARRSGRGCSSPRRSIPRSRARSASSRGGRPMFRDPPCEHAMVAHRFGPCAFWREHA
jgi:hypothetical protein